MEDYIRCTRCGKPVSTPVPQKTVLSAYVECPECISTQDDSKCEHTLVDARNEVIKSGFICTKCSATFAAFSHEPSSRREDLSVSEQNVKDIRGVIEDYYLALKNREHGHVAQDKCFHKIEEILGMQWSPEKFKLVNS